MLELDNYLKKKLSELQDLKKERLKEIIELKGKDEVCLCFKSIVVHSTFHPGYATYSLVN